MVLVATILKKFRAGIEETSFDGLSTEEELSVIRSRALAQLDEQAACWSRHLRPLLAADGIHFLDPTDYTPAIDAWLAQYFKAQIFPVLTPLAFDPGHPFPYISNLSMNLAVVVKDPAPGERFARLKVPDSFPRLLPIPSEEKADAYERLGLAQAHYTDFVWLEQVIVANLDMLFPGLEIAAAYPFA